MTQTRQWSGPTRTSAEKGASREVAARRASLGQAFPLPASGQMMRLTTKIRVKPVNALSNYATADIARQQKSARRIRYLSGSRNSCSLPAIEEKRGGSGQWTIGKLAGGLLSANVARRKRERSRH